MSHAPIFWFTGLSGAGKTTLAEAVRARLECESHRVLILDGDQVRETFHRNLGFTPEDIRENNRLIAELCAQRRAECDLILVPIISPFRACRNAARCRLSPRFFEIFLNAGLDAVRRRDVKGLYAKAKSGEMGPMIGAEGGVAYEPPEAPDLSLDTANVPPEISIGILNDFIHAHAGLKNGQ